MEDPVSAFTDISTYSKGVHGILLPYIFSKVPGVHIVTSTDESEVKTVVCGRTNVYDKCGRYKPIQDIGTDIVKKVRKGISYDDALHQGY